MFAQDGGEAKIFTIQEKKALTATVVTENSVTFLFVFSDKRLSESQHVNIGYATGGQFTLSIIYMATRTDQSFQSFSNKLFISHNVTRETFFL